MKKLLLPLVTLFLPTVCLAVQPGDVDTAFGSSGVAYMDSGNDDTVKSVIEQPDGKLLLGGFSSFRNPDDSTHYQISVARFNQDGTLDTSFDGDGKMQADPVTGRNTVFTMIQQADQKLVFAGCSCDGWGNSDGWLIARYNADGSVDSGFGTGGSRVLGYAEGFASGSPPASIYSAIQQPDGKLVLVGDAADTTTYTRQITVVRMASDGTFDTSFGDQGKVSLSLLGGYNEFARGVVQQPDGKLVLAATAQEAGYSKYQDLALVRLNTDGSLDSSFDGDGMVIKDIGGYADTGTAVVRQQDGSLLLLGDSYDATYNKKTVLVRFLENGSLDTGFAGTGWQYLNGMTARGVFQQADNRLVVTGEAYGTQFAFQRFELDGTPDASFGINGKKYVEMLHTTYGISAIQQRNGGLLLAGEYYSGSTSDFSLARIFSGQPDPDSDGYINGIDNCPQVANSTQANADSDPAGDACDPFPANPAEWMDTDTDGIGNNADTDDDGDGVNDVSDAFPLNAAESVDTDSDGIGNNADGDDDGDGAADTVDTAPLNPSIKTEIQLPKNSVFKGAVVRESASRK